MQNEAKEFNHQWNELYLEIEVISGRKTWIYVLGKRLSFLKLFESVWLMDLAVQAETSLSMKLDLLQGNTSLD